MQLLVINLHSARNAGDAALLEMTVHTLRSTLPGSRITLAMNDPGGYSSSETARGQSRLQDVKVIGSFFTHFRSRRGQQSRWRPDALVLGIAISLVAAIGYRARKRMLRIPTPWHELLISYANADMVVSCPGNIFASMGRLGMPLLVSAWTIAFALLLGKPLYVLPQSIGPFHHRWEHWLLRTLYSRARTVLIREPVSFRLVEQIGLSPAHVHLVPDLAFAYPPENRVEEHVALDRLRTCASPVVGVTVINRLIYHIDDETWDRYEGALAHALSQFLKAYGGSVVFFPQVTGPTPKEDDRIAARRIASRMIMTENVMVINELIPPNTLKAMYGLTDVFIATRMHSAIFASSMGVPTLLIEYLHKVRGLAEMLSMEQWMLNLSQVHETALWTKLDELWRERAAVRQHLAERIPEIVSQANHVGRFLIGDLA